MFSTRNQPLFAALLTSAVFASTCFAQQTQAPSQRFKPERNVPPSVHVPDAGARSLRATEQSQANSRSTSVNFSDTPAAAFRHLDPRRQVNQQHSTRQVSYNQEVGADKSRMPEIPAVLRETKRKADAPKQKIHQFQSPENLREALRPPARTEIQNTNHNIVVDEKQFADHRQRIDNSLNRNGQLGTRTQPKADGMNGIGSTLRSQSPVAQVQQVGFTQQQGSESANVANASLPVSQAVQQPSVQQLPVQSNRQPAGFVSQTVPKPAAAKLQQVSGDSEMIANAAMQMTTPGIKVQAFGPNSIGINKPATYKITISNETSEDAEKIQVGISMPETVDLQNINVSTGHHEIAAGDEKSRLVWNVERVPANTTHTIAINAIPRTAQPFDMDVEWTFAPRTGTTHVQVTEPQLQMKISGPTEVMFGEKATYDVSVLNPGTGNAEKVSVMLPEALGGERAEIGDVIAGGEKKFKVELFARTSGKLNLAATAVADGNIKAEAKHDILVRRANLSIDIEGPTMKYAGSIGQYTVTVVNDGDATAKNVDAVVAMPTGVKFLGGINNNSLENNDGGIKWSVGTLPSGDSRSFKVSCQLDASGSLVFQAGARGAGDLAATNECKTRVDTVADLTLDVEDPKGPLPTGENIAYKLIVRNRGSRSANAVDLVMQFSEGIEPVKASGFKNKVETGQVIFAPIPRIEPGQEIVLDVSAQALKSGTHIFRAQLTCEESDSREIAEGTTKFFGEEVSVEAQQIMLPAKANTANADTDTNDFK